MSDYPEGSWGYEAEKLLTKADALPWYLWFFKRRVRHTMASVRTRNRKAFIRLWNRTR